MAMFRARKRRSTTTGPPAPNPFDGWKAPAKRFRISGSSSTNTGQDFHLTPQTLLEATRATDSPRIPVHATTGDDGVDVHYCRFCGQLRGVLSADEPASTGSNAPASQPATTECNCAPSSRNADINEDIPRRIRSAAVADHPVKHFCISKTRADPQFDDLRRRQRNIITKDTRHRHRAQIIAAQRMAYNEKRRLAKQAARQAKRVQSTRTSESPHRKKASVPARIRRPDERPEAQCLVDIIWPDDGQWYPARIVRVRRARTSRRMSEDGTAGEGCHEESFIVEYLSDESREELSLRTSEYGTLWKHHGATITDETWKVVEAATGVSIQRREQQQQGKSQSDYERKRAENMARNLEQMQMMFGDDCINPGRTVANGAAGETSDLNRTASGDDTSDSDGDDGDDDDDDDESDDDCDSKSGSEDAKGDSATSPSSPASSTATEAASSSPPRRSSRRSPSSKPLNMDAWTRDKPAAKATTSSPRPKTSALKARHQSVKLKVQYDGPHRFVLYVATFAEPK